MMVICGLVNLTLSSAVVAALDKEMEHSFLEIAYIESICFLVLFLTLLLQHCPQCQEYFRKIIEIDLTIYPTVEQQHLQCFKTFLFQLPLLYKHHIFNPILLSLSDAPPLMKTTAECRLISLLLQMLNLYFFLSKLIFVLFVDHQPLNCISQLSFPYKCRQLYHSTEFDEILYILMQQHSQGKRLNIFVCWLIDRLYYQLIGQFFVDDIMDS